MTELNPIPPCLSHLTQRDAAIRDEALEDASITALSGLYNHGNDEWVKRTVSKVVHDIRAIKSNSSAMTPQMEERGPSPAPSDMTRETPGVAVLAGGVEHALDFLDDYIASQDTDAVKAFRVVAKAIRSPYSIGWKCGALNQGSAGGNYPAECNWPMCSCDPYAGKVIASLEESGAFNHVPVDRVERQSFQFDYDDRVELPAPFEGTRVTDPPFTARHVDLLNLLACVLRDDMDDAGRGADADLIEEKRAAAFPEEAKP